MTELRQVKIEGATSGNVAEVNSKDSLNIAVVGADSFGTTVEMPVSQKGYLNTVDFKTQGIMNGNGFRSEKFICLDIDESHRFVGITPSVPTQIFFRVKINSTAETQYKVYLEPTITDLGTALNPRSKNPHYQFISVAAESAYTFYEDPTTSSDGPAIRTQRWGYGQKLGGSSDPGEFTILSPDQTLMFEVTSKTNGNCIIFETDIIEIEQVDPDVTV